jgi:non-ribosomal peptide synthetase component F
MYPATFAASAPDRAAVVMGGSGEVVTCREVDERSNRFAHYLRHLDLGPDDVVAILMDNNPRYHEVAWGVRRIGRYFTPRVHDIAGCPTRGDDVKAVVQPDSVQSVGPELAQAPVPSARRERR